jgi:tetratricopeptide (TPR) repeat protein
MRCCDSLKVVNCLWFVATLALGIAFTNFALAADEGSATSRSSVSLATGRAKLAEAPASHERIEELIHQLGNSRFTVRRAAANELRQIGPEAFDLLHVASNNTDPEIAASARYLLRLITVRWVRNDDPPAMRRLLVHFGDLSDESRSTRVLQLAQLPDGEGIAGLCRIVRFDRSPLVSRQAALAIIRPDDVDAQPAPLDVDACLQELGPSSRVATTWLREYIRQLDDPAAAVAAWQPLIDDEAARLDQHLDETSPEIALGLLWNLAELHRQLGNQQSIIETADQMVALDDEQMDQTAIDLVSWLAKHEAWDTLDAFLAKHQPRLEQSKRPLYAVALARAEQGQHEVADKLAKRAAALAPQFSLDNFYMAKELEQRSKFDWSTREYRQVLDTQKVTSHEAILARIELANMQFDHADYETAAESLFPLIKAFDEDNKLGPLYVEVQRFDEARRGIILPDEDMLICRYHAYRAAQYREAQDWQRERDELEIAIKADPTDADVLIAMYRVPEASDAWRASTRKQIAQMANEFQQKIDEAPGDPTSYNQWAWLVSNTEGDYERAVRYSHRSIELNTSGKSAEASYLDTLGRCYYAVGDYENAVKYERQAIERVGHMQVMHRQLELFEKALAEKNRATNDDSGAKPSGSE